MKKIIILNSLIWLIISGIYGQTTGFFVPPHATDADYASDQDSHYVVVNTSVSSNGKLLVFLPGTGAKTNQYRLFPDLAASLGFHCISIAYPNGFPTVAALCAGSANEDCYKNIRQEVCYGTPVSDDVAVDTLNSISMRLVKALQYLENKYPEDGWSQFLNADQPAWNRIVVSGHSQGSGHALYLAKTNSVDRLIMFAGADDYSDYYNQPAKWISELSSTGVNYFFSFLHLLDDVMPYTKQYAIVQAAGMTAEGDDSTLVDNLAAPYNKSHCLYTKLPPVYPNVYSAKHDGMVVDFFTPLDDNDQPVYEPVWTYMLTTQVTTNTENIPGKDMELKVIPNPARDRILITSPSLKAPSFLEIINCFGKTVTKKYIPCDDRDINIAMDVSNLPKGPYIVRLGQMTALFMIR